MLAPASSLSRERASYSTHLAFGNFFSTSARSDVQRGRRNEPAQEAQSRAIAQRQLLNGGFESRPRRFFAALQNFGGTVRIVHPQNQRLLNRGGRSEAVRMIRIAFNLGRTAVVRFYQQAGHVAADAT